MPNPINSKKRHYPVGQRHIYVYWLVQGETDLSERAKQVARYSAEYELTAEEQAGLASSLDEIDKRRAKPKPSHQPDPYWSLWGRIKAAYRRYEEYHEDYDDCEGVKCFEDMVAVGYEEGESRRKPLVLPKRGIEVGGSPDELCWTGPDGSRRHKDVTSGNHAVAILRKLDTDDTYFREAGK